MSVRSLSRVDQSVTERPPGALEMKERARLMRDGAINNLSYLVSSVAGLAVVPIMLDGLGSQTYGVWVVALASAGLASILTSGLSLSVTREVADASRTGEERELGRFLGSAVSAYVTLGAVGAAAIFILGVPLSRRLGTHASLQGTGTAVFGLVGLAFLADQLVGYGAAVLAGLRRFGILNLLMAASALVRAAGIIALVEAGRGLVSVATCVALVSLLNAVVTFRIVKRLNAACRPTLENLVPMWKLPNRSFGFRSLLASGVSGASLQMPTILVGVLSSARLAGFYNIGQRFPMASAALIWRTSEVLFPAVSQASGPGAARQRREILEVGMRSCLILAFPLCITMGVLAPILLRAWVGAVPAGTATVLQLTSIAILLDAAGMAAMQVVWGQGYAGTVLVILSGIALTNVALGTALLFALGIGGMALGFLVAVTAGALAFVHVAARTCGTTALEALRAASTRLWPAAAACLGVEVALRIAPIDGWPSVAVTTIAGSATYLLVLRARAHSDERELAQHALGSLATLARLSYLSLRAGARRIPVARSGWYFLGEVRETIFEVPEKTRSALEDIFRRQQDPWGYDTTSGHGRLAREAALVREAVGGRFGRVLEVGCAEGALTEIIEPRCDSLLAIDVSRTALERARRRRAWGEHVQFAECDLRTQPIQGEFDVIFAVSVLEYIGRPREVRSAVASLTQALVPGGYLFIGNVRKNPVVENAWWNKHLSRGGVAIDHVVRIHPELSLIWTGTDDLYVESLFRKGK
jgi:O-antigen/teichoic acid export membrane protein/SAM-dependent methyltransferase